MFEAVVTLCLVLGSSDCREVLSSGYEATDKAGCEAALIERPPPEPGAFCRESPPGLGFEDVGAGVFLHRGEIAEPDAGNLGDVSNIAFIIGAQSVAVIDSGSAAWMGEAIWRAIRARTDLPVSHVILTHMHPDHVFGASVFAGAGAQVVAHAGLERALADRRENYMESLRTLIGAVPLIGTEAAKVDIAVESTREIDLGGRVLSLRAWPTAHTGNDLTAFDPTSGILFAGDLVFAEHTPALDGSLLGWLTVIDELKPLPAERVVPGHGGPLLDWPEGADPLEAYLNTLARDTRAAIAEGQRMGDAVTAIATSQAPHWQLFDAFNRRNATVAFSELEWE
ncbi:quinoprotein relay system zinc metallohydrolase 2 [Sulfitobacter sp. BDSS02]|nr:quinoprotein relay system zinc metallohydrolase 2 [Sulfitobacter sp. BDSS02]MBR9849726.1 quinoprotein relay system zinc metallohydrolase 2 [Paracoccaceae bacterium]